MKIRLKIKFRALLITFLTFDETYDLPKLGFAVPSVGYHKLVDARGIVLEIA